MKIINFLTSLLLLSSMAQALDCDVVQVLSKDSKTDQSRRGNGFAYTRGHIVLNDHTLAPESATVQLRQGNRTWSGEVVNRDFHTDLAVVKVNGANFKPCILQSVSQASVTVFGFDQKDLSLSAIPAVIKTEASTKLMVPGILRSLEIVASGQSELRSSQSGSILVESNRVVGMITQKTSEGTALAIPARDLDMIARQILENKLPKRNYRVNRRKGTFHFDGLMIPQIKDNAPKLGVGGVDPHGHRVTNPLTPDLSAPQPIALEDYEVGAVLVTVEDFSLLEKKQPNLARVLRDSQVKRFFVTSIDGKPVKNTLDLLRVLGECGTCIVDSFWVEVNDPTKVQDNTLKLMGWLSALIVELEKNNKASQVKSIVNAIQELNPKLAKLINDGNQHRMDLNIKNEIRRDWMAIESKLDYLWHSEATMDILTEIRAQLL